MIKRLRPAVDDGFLFIDERSRHRLPCCGFPHRDADSIYTRMRIVTVDPNPVTVD